MISFFPISDDPISGYPYNKSDYLDLLWELLKQFENIDLEAYFDDAAAKYPTIGAGFNMEANPAVLSAITQSILGIDIDTEAGVHIWPEFNAW